MNTVINKLTICFRGSCYNIQLKLYTASKMELFVRKREIAGNCCVLFTVVIYVTGLLDLPLKHSYINLDYNNKVFHPAFTYSN